MDRQKMNGSTEDVCVTGARESRPGLRWMKAAAPKQCDEGEGVERRREWVGGQVSGMIARKLSTVLHSTPTLAFTPPPSRAVWMPQPTTLPTLLFNNPVTIPCLKYQICHTSFPHLRLVQQHAVHGRHCQHHAVRQARDAGVGLHTVG